MMHKEECGIFPSVAGARSQKTPQESGFHSVLIYIISMKLPCNIVIRCGMKSSNFIMCSGREKCFHAFRCWCYMSIGNIITIEWTFIYVFVFAYLESSKVTSTTTHFLHRKVPSTMSNILLLLVYIFRHAVIFIMYNHIITEFKTTDH